MKHTPGPWRVNFEYIQCEITEVPIAVIKADSREGQDAQANARLIAAAPELLSVLKHAYQKLSAIDDYKFIKEVYELIKKAEGETP